jgi:hypothetical protein
MEDIFGDLHVGFVTICTIQILVYTVKPTRFITPLIHTYKHTHTHTHTHIPHTQTHTNTHTHTHTHTHEK